MASAMVDGSGLSGAGRGTTDSSNCVIGNATATGVAACQSHTEVPSRVVHAALHTTTTAALPELESTAAADTVAHDASRLTATSTDNGFTTTAAGGAASAVAVAPVPAAFATQTVPSSRAVTTADWDARNRAGGECAPVGKEIVQAACASADRVGRGATYSNATGAGASSTDTKTGTVLRWIETAASVCKRPPTALGRSRTTTSATGSLMGADGRSPQHALSAAVASRTWVSSHGVSGSRRPRSRPTAELFPVFVTLLRLAAGGSAVLLPGGGTHVSLVLVTVTSDAAAAPSHSLAGSQPEHPAKQSDTNVHVVL